ncbi:glutamate--tRNA ligase [bacterium]|nr:glutamate--tRNA ligase [bacterium]
MSQKPEVRTRIAPSPTGDPHIGTAYMLLFNYAFAKSQRGKVVLRIEDTDQARCTPESETAILKSLGWLGIQWDEGPDVGGPAGPYRQSERTDLYRSHCQILMDQGHAYRCFCTPEELAARRQERREQKQSTGYDGFCAELPSETVQANLDEAKPFVIRMRTPKSSECLLQDMLRGEIAIPWENVDDQVLLKSDGFPTYHLANVVDDHLMSITHIFRGEEWISSAPKHKLLYQYFGWQMPQLCHLPLLRNPDKSKLSKRKNPTSILYYRQAGFLPEALVNYLGLMGYTLPDEREMFTLQEMVETFDLKRIRLGGPIFDVQKLTWLNGRYIREKHSVDQLLARLTEWFLNDETWKKILPLIQPRAEKLTEILPRPAFFFADMVEYSPENLVPKSYKFQAETLPADLDQEPDPGLMTARLLRIVQWEMEKIRSWKAEALQQCFVNVAEKEGLKLRDVVKPFFLAISGSPTSTPLFESMAILGSDMTRRRIQHALDKLAETGHVISKKKEKALQEHYQKTYGPNI